MKSFKQKIFTKKVISLAVAVVIVFVTVFAVAGYRRSVMVTDGEIALQLTTYSTQTHKILKQANVEISTRDEVVRSDTGDKILIDIRRAFPVTIIYHTETRMVHLASGTVSDAIESAGIRLSKNDMLNYSANTEIFENMQITVKEVKYIDKTEIKDVDYKTVYKESEDYPEGYEEVVTAGKKGEEKVVSTYTYIDGALSCDPEISEETITKPVDEVVLKGTAKAEPAARIISGDDSASGSDSVSSLGYSRVLTGSATAYTASQGALTATGVAAYVGGVAVNPNIIPYGTKMYIVSTDGFVYGYATAVDTGGALMDGSAIVDLYFSTYDECVNFGRRTVNIYILD